MFTGIIEEIGQVKKFSVNGNNAFLCIICDKILNGIKIGDSISVNGVCQTVIEFDDTSFSVEVSRQTLEVTNFSAIKSGDFVNLERALTPSSRMGGHIVQGHVDKTAKLLKSEKLGEFYNMYFETDETRLIIPKGSISINGISLTVADVNDTCFKIAVIPHTYKNTNLQYLKIGDIVNVETDILGRYVEKFLSPNDNKSNITMEFLAENGYV